MCFIALRWFPLKVFSRLHFLLKENLLSQLGIWNVTQNLRCLVGHIESYLCNTIQPISENGKTALFSKVLTQASHHVLRPYSCPNLESGTFFFQGCLSLGWPNFSPGVSFEVQDAAKSNNLNNKTPQTDLEHHTRIKQFNSLGQQPCKFIYIVRQVILAFLFLFMIYWRPDA